MTVAGKRKRKDLQTASNDCNTPETSKLPLMSIRRTAGKSCSVPPSSKALARTAGKQVSTKAAQQGGVANGSSRKGVVISKHAHSRQRTWMSAGASAPEPQHESTATETAQRIQAKASTSIVPDSNDDDMPDASPSKGPSVEQDKAMLQSAVPVYCNSTAGPSTLPSGAPVLLPGASSRFSARHLKQKVEAKLPVSKATPVGLPPTPLLPPAAQ